MKQTQVGVHPLLSVAVIAGLLGLADYGQAAPAVETTGWIVRDPGKFQRQGVPWL